MSAHIACLPQGDALWHRLGEGARQFHFSAANGFPVNSYQFLLNRLACDYSGIATENRGMWPALPPPKQNITWHDYADDLLAVLDLNGVTKNKPIIGVGHSLGGAVTLLAAIKRPELFSSLVLIDSATKPNGIGTPAEEADAEALIAKLEQSTQQRRSRWTSRDEFLTFLPSRGVYQGFCKQALEDYALHGLLERPDGGLQLAYAPLWEAHNFITTPDMWASLAAAPVPTLFLYGSRSFLYPAAQVAVKQLDFNGNVKVDVINGGGHLAAQDSPDETYRLLNAWFKQTLA